MDEEFCRERAKTVRELADKADPFIKKRLLELANHYERRLAISPTLEAEKETAPGVSAVGPITMQTTPRKAE
jgi:hypothetical protein